MISMIECLLMVVCMRFELALNTDKCQLDCNKATDAHTAVDYCETHLLADYITVVRCTVDYCETQMLAYLRLTAAPL